MATQQYDDNVIINGTEDEVQLQVQGTVGQTEVLQTWEQDNGQVVAQVSANGRIQAGDIGSTGDAIIEAYRNGSASLPERGIATFGLLTTFLSGAVTWLLSELEINSPDSFAGIFRALRGKVTFNSSGDASDADLRAGDFIAINQSGTSGLAVKRMSALQGFVDNQSGAYLGEANGASVLLHNLTAAEINILRGLEVQSPLNQGTINTLVGLDIADMDQGTANFAIRTGKGIVQIGDAIHVEQQTAIPSDEADVVQVYAKDGKLYAKAPSPSNTIYDLTASSGGSGGIGNHGCFVYSDTIQTFAHNNSLPLAFNQERKDSDGYHDPLTNPSRLTIPVGQAGTYQMVGNLRWASNTNGSVRALYIRLNGSDVIAYKDMAPNAGDSILQVTTLYDLAEGDYIELIPVQNSGGSLDITISAQYSPEFRIQRMA